MGLFSNLTGKEDTMKQNPVFQQILSDIGKYRPVAIFLMPDDHGDYESVNYVIKDESYMEFYFDLAHKSNYGLRGTPNNNNYIKHTFSSFGYSTMDKYKANIFSRSLLAETSGYKLKFYTWQYANPFSENYRSFVPICLLRSDTSIPNTKNDYEKSQKDKLKKW